MDFVRARNSDIEKICEIIEEGRSFLRLQGVDQWQTDFPDIRKITSDVENGFGYVMKDEGEVIGYSALIRGTDPTYLDIEGEWLTDGSDYLTVHRAAVTSKYRGRGYGNLLFSYYKNHALANGIPSIRIDTHSYNLIIQKLILHNGFRYCGIITVADGTKRNAYELTFE